MSVNCCEFVNLYQKKIDSLVLDFLECCLNFGQISFVVPRETGRNFEIKAIVSELRLLLERP